MQISKNATGVCKLCFKPVSSLSFSNLFSPKILCENCKNELNPHFRRSKFNGRNIYWFYSYNEAFRNAIYSLKGCGDFEMREIFLNDQAIFLKKFFCNRLVVPAPSYFERDEKRGFNHVVSIFETMGLPLENCLIKTEDRKQADLSKEERAKIHEVIKLKNGSKLVGKRILVVDDIMTTGSTIKACLKLLEAQKPRSIEVFVLARVART